MKMELPSYDECYSCYLAVGPPGHFCFPANPKQIRPRAFTNARGTKSPTTRWPVVHLDLLFYPDSQERWDSRESEPVSAEVNSL